MAEVHEDATEEKRTNQRFNTGHSKASHPEWDHTAMTQFTDPSFDPNERSTARIHTGKSSNASQRVAPPKPMMFVLAVCGYVMIALVTWPKGWPGKDVNGTNDYFGYTEGNVPHPAFPGGVWFAVMIVVVTGNLLGMLVEKTTGLPALLGMLVSGMLLKNCLQPIALSGMSTSLNSTIRNMALGIIMIRAGLGLDILELKKQCSTMAFLSFVPCCGEAVTIAGISMALFARGDGSGMTVENYQTWDFIWGLQLGFIIADVSPAVTTPLLLYFNDKGYGKAKGIPTILMAAGSVNSVMAIVMYSICKEFAWGGSISGDQMVQIIGIKLFVQIFGVGLIFGWVVGWFASFAWMRIETTEQRFVLLFSSCMMLLFGWKKIGLGGGGTLAALSFGASLQYYIKVNELEPTKVVEVLMAKMWKNLGSVLLFTLLGASLDFKKLEGSLVGFGAIAIVVGLIGRSIVTILSVAPIKTWNLKEKFFAVITWCPKATVQAALASDALDQLVGYCQAGTELGGGNETVPLVGCEEGSTKSAGYLMYEYRAMVILTTAILSIIMTAPTFAVAMSKGGPILLEREK